MTTPSSRRSGRAVLAGVIGAAALATGAGVAYAASTTGVGQPVETGYATVVDETTPGATGGSREDCPDRGGSGGGQDGSTAPGSPDAEAGDL